MEPSDAKQWRDVVEVRPARLVNPIRSYAWGSKRAIAELQDRPTPTAEPEAELWLGGHAAAPSFAILDGEEVPLDVLIASDPVAWLGEEDVARFGPQLPFMLKVLAADRPLSLQAHPDAVRARSGFAAEEARGVPLDAPARTYRDPWPKPELLRALTPFTAFSGFRDAKESRELFAALAVPALAWVLDLLEDGQGALHSVVRRLLTWPGSEAGPAMAALAESCRRLAAAGGDWSAEATWGQRLAQRYPNDPGVAVALLLELVHLEPGEAVHLPPGRLHAYLHGVAIEVMAASDNVLRGGLTDKHIDPAELLEVVDAEAPPVTRVAAVHVRDELLYAVEEPYFRLSEITVSADAGAELDPRGAQLLLATSGSLTLTAAGRTLVLRSGESAIVPAATGTVALTGVGTVFRATAGGDRGDQPRSG